MPRQWGGTNYLICLNASVQHSTGNCLHVENLFHPMKHALSSVYWRWSSNLFQDLRETTQLEYTNQWSTDIQTKFFCYAGDYIWLYDRNYKLINMENSVTGWWDANHLKTSQDCDSAAGNWKWMMALLPSIQMAFTLILAFAKPGRTCRKLSCCQGGVWRLFADKTSIWDV